jgi:hypothetical protein
MTNWVLETLPVPVAGSPGSVVNLENILSASFDHDQFPNLGYYGHLWIAYSLAPTLFSPPFSYWNPSNPIDARWFLNGVDIGPDHYNPWADVASTNSAALRVGNDIGDFAYLAVPVAGANGIWTEMIRYSIITIDPVLLSPTAANGEPTLADIVASAQRFAATYVNPPNSSDCHNIAEAVAAAAGATLGGITGSTTPSENQDGGFWRVVYRGSDPNPISNWQTLVQPGDIVRMVWQSGPDAGGPHTTTGPQCRRKHRSLRQQ